jgi:hypothetical protein
MLGQIFRYSVASRASGQIDHCLNQLSPVLTSVSRTSRNLIGLVARSADALDYLLTIPFGQLGRLALRRERNDYNEKKTGK